MMLLESIAIYKGDGWMVLPHPGGGYAVVYHGGNLKHGFSTAEEARDWYLSVGSQCSFGAAWAAWQEKHK